MSEVYSNTRFKKDGGFCVRKKVIKRDIYQIIIPMILENILQISANLVITAMVGRLLANDISAQGICIRITDTLWCFYKGVAIGATVLIARAYGAGRHQDCRKIAEQTILTEMIIVFIFQVVLYFKAPLFLGFFSKDPQILSLAEGYMKTIIFEFPFVVITTVVTASFQGYGNTLRMLAAYVLRLPLIIIWIIIAMDQVSRFLLSVGLYYRINKKREQTMNAV